MTEVQIAISPNQDTIVKIDHDHKFSEWEAVVKQPKKRELLSMRFCKKCWKQETKTERIDL